MFGAHRIKALGLIDCPLGAMYDEPWNAHGLKGFNMTHFNDQLKMVYNGWEGYVTFFCHMMYDGNDDKVTANGRELASKMVAGRRLQFSLHGELSLQARRTRILRRIS